MVASIPMVRWLLNELIVPSSVLIMSSKVLVAMAMATKTLHKEWYTLINCALFPAIIRVCVCVASC